MTLITHFINTVLSILKYKNVTLMFTKQQFVSALVKNVVNIFLKKRKCIDCEKLLLKCITNSKFKFF